MRLFQVWRVCASAALAVAVLAVIPAAAKADPPVDPYCVWVEPHPPVPGGYVCTPR